jgi:hypothetical protein
LSSFFNRFIKISDAYTKLSEKEERDSKPFSGFNFDFGDLFNDDDDDDDDAKASNTKNSRSPPKRNKESKKHKKERNPDREL